MIKKILILIFFLFMTQNIFSVNPQILIEENSTFIEQSSKNYEVNTFGKITILNPSLINQIYQMGISLNNSNNLIIGLLNSSNITLNQNKIYSNNFDLNNNFSFEYKISGILTYLEYKSIRDNLNSIFELESSLINLKPLREAKLNKLERENQSTTNISQREIIVEIINPTKFEVNLKYLRLFKTDSNTSAIINNTITLSEVKNIYLNSNQDYISHEIDFNSDDKSIYWIEYEVITINNITRDLKFKTISRSSSSNNNEEDSSVENNVEEEIVFKKTSSKVSMSLNEKTKISLEFRNPNSEMHNLLLTDFLPSQFISDSNLSFNIENIKKNETLILDYFMNLTKSYDLNIIYLESAVIKFDDGENLFSNSLNIFYNNISKVRKIIVEKELLPQENSTKVIIRIKNIGTIDIQDILVIVKKDNSIILDSNLDNIKYRWNIDVLKINEEWSISYELPKDIFDSSLPEIFIPEDTIIYRTLVLNEIVESNYNTFTSPTITIVVATAVILLLVDIIF